MKDDFHGFSFFTEFVEAYFTTLKLKYDSNFFGIVVIVYETTKRVKMGMRSNSDVYHRRSIRLKGYGCKCPASPAL
jgi:hypothetical protein